VIRGVFVDVVVREDFTVKSPTGIKNTVVLPSKEVLFSDKSSTRWSLSRKPKSCKNPADSVLAVAVV
jgi:hypothetical protein